MSRAAISRPRRLPPLSAIRAFDAVARQEGVSAAARELLVTPGAISRQIRQLEEYLNCVLFDRKGGRLFLTMEGREYRASVVQAFDFLEASTNRLAGLMATRELAVSCTPSFHLKWLVPRLADFEAQYPDVQLRIYTAYSTHHEFQDLGIDAAIGVGEWPQNASLMQVSFMTDYSGPVMTPDVYESVRRDDGRLDFRRLRRLRQRSTPNIWEGWHSVANEPWEDGPSAEFDHMFLAIEAAKAGLGACIAPFVYLMTELESGQLIAPYGFTKHAVPYHITWRSAGKKKPSLEAFINWLRKEGKAASEAPVPARAYTTMKSSGSCDGTETATTSAPQFGPVFKECRSPGAITMQAPTGNL